MSEPRPTPPPLAGEAHASSLAETAVIEAVQLELRRRIQPVIGGRYRIIGEIGRGGMGAVYEALDLQLDRRVAIKRLSRVSASTLARFATEVRAHGRLEHPAIVRVFDVAINDDDPYLVMELVSGPTLRTWQREHPWPVVLPVYVQAGEGLASAHAAGLVHRDFKPANVMVELHGEQPRARVLDFGLALDRQQLSVGATPTAESPEPSTSDARLTETGTLLGTPAFMAPEQCTGRELGPQADQFSFCASLWLGVYGQHPFSGSTLNARLAAIEAAAIETPRDERGVPRWLQQALRRGLAADPVDRHASMNALLDVLRHSTVSRRRRATVLGAGSVALAAAVATFAAAGASNAPVACDGARAHLDGVWDHTRRQSIRAALTQTELSYADDAWRHVDRRLGRYADAWVQLHTDACRATVVDDAQSEADMDLTMACLHRARARLASTTDVLVDIDTQAIPHVTALVASLPSLARCSNLEALRSTVEPPDPSIATEVAEIRGALEHARAARIAGKTDRARQHIEHVRPTMAAVDYPPIRAELALEDGLAKAQQGELSGSEAALSEALRLASAHHQTEVVLEASTALILNVGDGQRRLSDAMRYVEIAEHFVGDDADAEARLRNAAAGLLLRAGRIDEVEQELRRAIALATEAHGDEAPERFSNTYSNLAVALAEQGRFVEAAEILDSVLATEVVTKGATHPDVLGTRHNLAVLLGRAGRYEAARAEVVRAIELATASLPPDAPLLLDMRATYVSALLALGRSEEAMEPAMLVVAERRKRLGSDHPAVMMATANLAAIELRAGHVSDALRHAERAWAALQAEQVAPRVTGRVALTLASALAASDPSSTERQRQLLETARATFDRMGPAGRDHAREAAAQLAALDVR